MFKKIFLTAAVIFFITASASAEQFVPLSNGLGAYTFLKNWGYESYWNTNKIAPNGIPNMVTYIVLIPAKSSGLGKINTGEDLGALQIVTLPNSGEVVGVELPFNASSMNPKKTLTDAFIAAIRINNFNIDKVNFENAASKVLSGQQKYEIFYSENMRRGYMIAINPQMSGFYTLNIFAFN